MNWQTSKTPPSNYGKWIICKIRIFPKDCKNDTIDIVYRCVQYCCLKGWLCLYDQKDLQNEFFTFEVLEWCYIKE